MNVKQLLGAIVGMMARIALAAVIIVAVFRLAVGAYNFGYQVFADIPMEEDGGRVVSIIVTEEQDSRDVAKLLEQRGLIADANVFYVQEQLSKDFKDNIQPGTYELSSGMSAAEMLRILCRLDEETEE
ncbi:MAG: endolytic transglycosylase MltG [Roseburia sp.]|nr:endolytic transglycosylase MltG [Roseburia sp.]